LAARHVREQRFTGAFDDRKRGGELCFFQRPGHLQKKFRRKLEGSLLFRALRGYGIDASARLAAGGRFAAGRRDHVDVRVIRAVAGNAGADLQHGRVGIGAVLQAVAVRITRPEPSAGTRSQQLGACIGDQRHFPAQHENEFVGCCLPKTLAGPGARRQPQQVDAELG